MDTDNVDRKTDIDRTNIKDPEELFKDLENVCSEESRLSFISLNQETDDAMEVEDEYTARARLRDEKVVLKQKKVEEDERIFKESKSKQEFERKEEEKKRKRQMSIEKKKKKRVKTDNNQHQHNYWSYI